MGKKFDEYWQRILNIDKWEAGIRIGRDPGEQYAREWIRDFMPQMRRHFIKKTLIEVNDELKDLKLKEKLNEIIEMIGETRAL